MHTHVEVAHVRLLSSSVMGIRACLSVLLIAGALHVPLFSASAESIASSTPEAPPLDTASFSEPTAGSEPPPSLELASTTASSTPEAVVLQTLSAPQDPRTHSPFDRGFGAQTEVLPTEYETLPGYGALSIHALVDGVTVSDGEILSITPRQNILVSASTTISGTSVIDADETRQLAEAVHTVLAIYRGVPGNAELVAGTYTISEAGILSDIGGKPLESLDVGPALSEPGEYFIVVHPEFGANEYPPGWGPQEFGGPRIDLVPKWDFWANHDFYTRQTLFQGSQVFGILRFTIGSPTPEHQMSNVLFLPGIKASRLYEGSSSCLEEDCFIKRWEPLLPFDIEKIYLNSSGEGTEEIFVKRDDIISKINILDKNLYASFSESLSEMQRQGFISDWSSIAYDWRLSLDQIVSSGRKDGDRIYYDNPVESPYIEQTLRELASTSKSGKVTVVAHSNGGLVAKALMQKLGDAETASLIDNVILLGVPQAGAPQTVGALLFGHKEGLPFDWLPVVMTVSDAREFALNSPMSYHLLPTDTYFDSLTGVEHPVARFYAGDHYQAESAAYDQVVDTAGELYAYLSAEEGGRTMPSRSDLDSANILNTSLLRYAEDVHRRIDTWSPPQSVDVYQVAGWGADTIAGYEFYEEAVRLPFLSGTKAKFRPVFVEDGDGIVPVPSALAMPQSERVHNYWINLRREREGHMTLLESNSVISLITEVLRGEEPKEVLDFVSKSGHTPWIERPERQLRFVLHSPLTLSVTDHNGNEFGLATDGTVTEEIEGGRFGQIGEMKFVSVPYGPRYTVAMQGLDDGTFSLDVEEVEGNALVKRTTFAGLPSTQSTIATLQAESAEALSNLFVDTDGDGVNNIALQASAGGVVMYSSEEDEAESPTPSDPETQSRETEPNSSSGGGSSRDTTNAVSHSQNLWEEALPLSETEDEITHTEESLIPTTATASEPETMVKAASGEVPEIRPDTSTLSASALNAFQQLWSEFLLPMLYTIKDAFLSFLRLFL